jgi:hypothetical protein
LARKSNSLRRRNGQTYPALTQREKRQVEIFLIALGGGLGALAGGSFAGGKGAAIGGAVGVGGALTLIYTQD